MSDNARRLRSRTGETGAIPIAVSMTALAERPTFADK
jgi:hypothetical protein